MRERTRQLPRAEQEVCKALDVLEAKRGAPFFGPRDDNPGAVSANEMAAGNRLFEVKGSKWSKL